MMMVEVCVVVCVCEIGGSVDFNYFYCFEQGLVCCGIDCFVCQMIVWFVGIVSCGIVLCIGMVDIGINVSYLVFVDSCLYVYCIGEGCNVDFLGQIYGILVVVLLVGQVDSCLFGLVLGVELIVVDVFYLVGKDECVDVFDLIEVLDYLGVVKVGIINLLLVGLYNVVFVWQVWLLDGVGIVMVVVVGNGGLGVKFVYFVVYELVIVVMVVDWCEQVYCWVGWGKYIDFVVLGVDIWIVVLVSGVCIKIGIFFVVFFVMVVVVLLM